MNSFPCIFPINAATPAAFIRERRHFFDSNLVIQKIDIGSIKSYQSWKRKLQSKLNANVEKGCISSCAAVEANKSLEGDACVYMIGGPATVAYFMWGNGEIKILPIWNSKFIIQSDLYWLNSYPFLKAIGDRIEPDFQLYSIIGRQGSPISSNDDSSVFLNVSHNNHFGHFLLDNLPLLNLLKGPLGAKYGSRSMKALYSYGCGIKELLSFVGLSIGNHEILDFSTTPGAPFLIEHSECLDIISTSSYVNAYLWRLYYLSWSRVCDLKQPLGRIALLRSGRFATRVSNRAELEGCLLGNGFKIIDPSSFAISSLVDVLLDADMVVCESGSCTLSAAMFSGKDTRIFSFNPSRLLLNPDAAMVHGGLPYLLPFLDRIEFIHGDTRLPSSIQSSDICNYDLSYLEELIRN